jgi:hypothetical protein
MASAGTACLSRIEYLSPAWRRPKLQLRCGQENAEQKYDRLPGTVQRYRHVDEPAAQLAFGIRVSQSENPTLDFFRQHFGLP